MIPAPTVTVPPAGTHGFPFMSSTADLSKSGYAESEFLFSGTAQAYTSPVPLSSDGRWNVSPGVTAPYTVRMLVRRPTNPARFNGTVVVEWLNVTNGYDLHADWSLTQRELLREGYAYVGVTAQFLGALSLQLWETGPQDRYATIFHPGDSFQYDIFSQAARAIRAPAPGVAPLGNLTPGIQALIATGASQSAGALYAYYNAVQPLVHAYDGFLLNSFITPLPLSTPLSIALPIGPNVPPVPPGVPVTPSVPSPTTPNTRIRTDQATPVLVAQTETEPFIGGTSPFQTGLDAQLDAPNYRLWSSQARLTETRPSWPRSQRIEIRRSRTVREHLL